MGTPAWNRRRFFERLGLLGTAPLLQAAARGLWGEAHAASRRAFVVVVVGEALPLAPAFVPAGVSVGETARWSAEDRAAVELPAAFQALAPFRNRIALVDGLANDIGGRLNHGTSFAALAGVRPDSPGDMGGGRASAITIDQHIANVIGAGSAEKSLRFGVSGENRIIDELATTFAAGAMQPLAHVGRPSLLYARLAGNRSAGADPVGAADPSIAAALRGRLLDRTRDEVKRLQGALAGPERIKLDGYLAAIDQFDRKQQQLRQISGSASCSAPPDAVDGRADDRLRSMFAMATLALRCGLTNVVGVSVGHGGEHDDLGVFRGGLLPAGNYGSHGPIDLYEASMQKVYGFVSEQVAALIAGSGLADGLVALIVPGTGVSSGSFHHGFHDWRNPALVYDGTGTLRTGSRYLRLGRGCLPDLYASVAHAADAPIDRFGVGGVNKLSGPISSLMS